VRTLILFALLSLLQAVPASPNQDRSGGQFAISVDVDLVVFNVTVRDDKDRHVSGLKASDFQIREDNRLQDIRLFNAEDSPASVGLIIDNSGSMRDKYKDVASAALAFVDASNPEDEMFVIHFNEKVYLSLPSTIRFTSSPEQLRSALFGIVPDGMTALYDALVLAIGHLKFGTRDRKALVVMSDGGDNASTNRLDDVLQVAQRSSATVYTIGIYDSDNLDRNPKVLRKIAESSGGRAYFPGSIKGMEQVWRDIAGGNSEPVHNRLFPE
jgi:Ca-activated chloride channel homolog